MVQKCYFSHGFDCEKAYFKVKYKVNYLPKFTNEDGKKHMRNDKVKRFDFKKKPGIIFGLFE